ncbi:TetR/AcrR family transcriptional regulator [Catenuloplanes atrovinosus]|uniref:AcrR family transcriptional regulator n=1 Tax=Catenuloplanes atrovinosus TaxID=137266 RepID=A0AAE3YR67_9ACTN|nr:TetR/AcrR family transcriptional regulator [Catenuloplanes atrovinosus]MDR7278344.1 AcrR family transcriptional regulator [Catenuloplanes atrovinosus]
MTTPTDDEIRTRVLDAADRLYNARGIQAVGMDALRAEAGVPLKRIYRLFPAKDAIVEAVLDRRHRLWNSLVEEAVASTPAPRDRLLAIYDMLARWFDEDDFRGCVFINTFGELGTASPRVAEIVRAHKAEFQARVARLCAEAGAPEWLAPQLAILAEGAQTTAAIAGTNAAAGHARAAAEILIGTALSEERT